MLPLGLHVMPPEPMIGGNFTKGVPHRLMVIRKRGLFAGHGIGGLGGVFIAIGLVGLAACSSIGAQTSQSLEAKGCKIDAARICAAVKNKPVAMAGTGLMADQRMLEQDSLVTADITMPIPMPQGEPDLEIHCGINPKYQSVTYANVAPGPPVSDDDVKCLRARGYCSE
jgi:hypothetical protein